eukprot:4047967-Amphidinium_carterae.2
MSSAGEWGFIYSKLFQDNARSMPHMHRQPIQSNTACRLRMALDLEPNATQWQIVNRHWLEINTPLLL